MEQNSPIEEIVDLHINGSKATSIALKDVVSANDHNLSSANKKPSTPDTARILKDTKCTTILLLCATILVIGVMLIPIILFYTIPEPDGVDINDFVDFRKCQVYLLL